MADSGRLKSAYELAMERLRAKDREAGVQESAPLNEEQKARIAEVGGDPEKAREIEDRYRVDRDRVERKLESDVSRIRRGE